MKPLGLAKRLGVCVGLGAEEEKLFDAQVGEIWLALWATWTATGLDADSRSSFARRVGRTLEWLLRTASTRGVADVVSALKRVSAAYRASATSSTLRGTPLGVFLFGDGPRSGARRVAFLAQVSHLGRALPAPPRKVLSLSLTEQRERLCSEAPTVASDVLSEVATFAHRWGAKHPPKGRIFDLSRTSSACLEKSRAEGGRAAALAAFFEEVKPLIPLEEEPATIGGRPAVSAVRLLDRAVPEECAYPLWARTFPHGEGFVEVPADDDRIEGLDEWNEAVLSKGCLEVLLFEARAQLDSGRLPAFLPDVVAERGWKTRPVTSGPTILMALGDVLRGLVFTALRQWAPIAHVLRGDKVGSATSLVESSRLLPHGGVWVSTDLTAATDLALQGPAAALMDGLLATWNVDPRWRRIAKALLGKGWLLPPRQRRAAVAEASRFGFLTEAQARELGADLVVRGILMGSPLTWSALCLSQAFAVDRAWRDCLPNLPPEWRQVNPDQTFRVCGDDLLAYWPEAVQLRYEVWMRRLGYVFSPGKHFVSRFGAVFLERVYRPRLSVSLPRKRTALLTLDADGTCHWLVREAGSLPRVPTYSEVSTLPRPSRFWSRQGIWMVARRRMRQRRIVGLDPIPTVPIRLFMPGGSKGKVRDCQIPWWASVGPAVEALEERGSTVVLRLASTFFGNLGEVFRTLGIVPEAPRSLGGANLPWCKTSRRACRAHRKAAVGLCTGALQDLSFLSRPWSAHTTSSWWDLAESMASEPSDANDWGLPPGIPLATDRWLEVARVSGPLVKKEDLPS
uniref:RNA-dependent RNA polymerase n=1 Tax=Serbia narna-like virus 2 TaxID=2771457 RepID=A0A7H1C8Z8_9VIRU|nr:RNA-dependent RNA polymerase [Serbia narna-like virus 2]